MNRMPQAAIVACLVGAVAGTVLIAQQNVLEIRLRWTEHSRALPTAVDMTGGLRTLYVESVVDKRDPDTGGRKRARRTQIGENIETKVAVPILTDSDVAEFVSKSLLRQFKSVGLPVVPGDADLVLRLELTEFWATETTRYVASVRARGTLTDAHGKEVWVGMVSGVGNNSGRSLHEENYNETFTSAVIDLAANLLKQDAFMRGLKKAP